MKINSSSIISQKSFKVPSSPEISSVLFAVVPEPPSVASVPASEAASVPAAAVVSAVPSRGCSVDSDGLRSESLAVKSQGLFDCFVTEAQGETDALGFSLVV